MELKLLKSGDKVINVTDKLIAVEHASGDISLFFYVIKKGRLSIQERVALSYADEDGDEYNQSSNDLEVIRF